MFHRLKAFALPAFSSSSPQGSEFVTYAASASGNALVRAGLPINLLATSNEPCLPSRQLYPPTGNPSPLNYLVAPECIPVQTDNLTDYPDGPYIPPYFHHPPPLTSQNNHPSPVISQNDHQPLLTSQNRHDQYDSPSPQLVSYPLPAPPVQRDLPEPSISSSSDSSVILDSVRQVPSQADSLPDNVPPPISDPLQVLPPRCNGPVTENYHSDKISDSSGPLHLKRWTETDKYLRTQIGIPEGTRVDLWALPDPPLGQKPQQPLPILVKLAIHGCEKGMLTLQEIYKALENRFEYFSLLQNAAWKNSIRHNLSLNQVFRSCDRPITEPGKGRYWSLDISRGEGYKRERRRKRRNTAPYNGTRDLPGGIGNRLNSGDSSDPDDEITATGGRVMTVKTSKRGRKRGPYTRIKVGRPSVPGSTGITAGGVAAGTFVAYQPNGSNSPASCAASPASHTGVPAAPSSAEAIGSGPRNYRFRTTFSEHCQVVDVSPAPTSSVTSASHLHQENPQMRDIHSTVPATLPFPSSYRGMYFNRVSTPKFGEVSLTMPSTLVPWTRVGFLNPVGGTMRRGRTASVISISSDEMSSPEVGERIVGGTSGSESDQ